MIMNGHMTEQEAFANFVENIGKVGLINMDSMDNNNENRINYCDNPKQDLYYQLKQLTFDTNCQSFMFRIFQAR